MRFVGETESTGLDGRMCEKPGGIGVVVKPVGFEVVFEPVGF